MPFAIRFEGEFGSESSANGAAVQVACFTPSLQSFNFPYRISGSQIFKPLRASIARPSKKSKFMVFTC
jgi:hypothetical protein